MKEILDADSLKEDEVLTDRLEELNREIRDLRFKQKVIIELLKCNNRPEAKLLLDQEDFVNIFDSMGFDDASREAFHKQFEQSSPKSHQFFLELLGMEDEEIKMLRSK
jgi:hypothetical protein